MTAFMWPAIVALYLLSVYFIGIPLAKKSLKVMEVMNSKNDNGSKNEFSFRSFCFFPIREFLYGDFYYTENSICCFASIFTEFYYTLAGFDRTMVSNIEYVEKRIYILIFAILWPIKFVINLLIMSVIALAPFMFVVFGAITLILAGFASFLRWLVVLVREKMN